MSYNGEFLFVSTYFGEKNHNRDNAQKFIDKLMDEFGMYSKDTTLMLTEELKTNPFYWNSYPLPNSIVLPDDSRHAEHLAAAFWPDVREKFVKILELAESRGIDVYYYDEYMPLESIQDLLSGFAKGQLVQLNKVTIARWDKLHDHYNPTA